MNGEELAQACQSDATDIVSRLQRHCLAEARSVGELLQQGDAARKEGRWSIANERLGQALQLAETDESLCGSLGSVLGLVRMSLGALYQAKGDFLTAITYYQKGEAAFVFDRQNAEVAIYARGIANAWRGETSLALQAKRSLMSLNGSSDVQVALDRRCEEIRKMLAAPTELLGLPPPPHEPPSKDPRPGDDAPKSPLTWGFPKIPQPSETPGVTLVILIIMIVVIGAAIVLASGHTSAAPIYLMTLAICCVILYLYFGRLLQVEVPPGCAAVFLHFGQMQVRLRSFHRWPVVTRVCAVVPLYPLRYTTPKQRVIIGVDQTVELRLAVTYRVNTPCGSQDHEDICKAIYCTQEISPSTSQEGKARKKSGPLMPGDVKQLWEKRLTSDIVMTLNEVLPGCKYEDLASDEGQKRLAACQRILGSLRDRTVEWGVVPEDTQIVDLSRVKL